MIKYLFKSGKVLSTSEPLAARTPEHCSARTDLPRAETLTKTLLGWCLRRQRKQVAPRRGLNTESHICLLLRTLLSLIPTGFQRVRVGVKGLRLRSVPDANQYGLWPSQWLHSALGPATQYSLHYRQSFRLQYNIYAIGVTPIRCLDILTVMNHNVFPVDGSVFLWCLRMHSRTRLTICTARHFYRPWRGGFCCARH